MTPAEAGRGAGAPAALRAVGRRDRVAVPRRRARPPQRDHLRHGRHLDRRRPDRRRRVGRSGTRPRRASTTCCCRWSTSARSARAAARSPGSRRAATCVSGRESAGADPGPACYGRGGDRPTVTDADLVLGILDPAHFLGGRLAARRRTPRGARSRRTSPRRSGCRCEEAAAGIKRVVDARMGDLLRTVTIEQGHDPREFVLYAFGGAGATHAPAFALELVDEILVPASQSVHSAFGAVASDIALTLELAVPMRLSSATAAGPRSTRSGSRRSSASSRHGRTRGWPRRTSRRGARGSSPGSSRCASAPDQGAAGAAVAARGRAARRTSCVRTRVRYSADAIPETCRVRARHVRRRGTRAAAAPAARALRACGRRRVARRAARRRVYDPTRGLVRRYGDLSTATRSAGEPSSQDPRSSSIPGTTVALVSGQERVVDELLGVVDPPERRNDADLDVPRSPVRPRSEPGRLGALERASSRSTRSRSRSSATSSRRSTRSRRSR